MKFSPMLGKSKLGDPRDRTSGQLRLAPPLVEQNGHVTVLLDPRGPLQTSPQGTVVLNLGPALEVATGSPPELRIAVSDSVVVKNNKLHAVVKASDVHGIGQHIAAIATPIADAAVAAIPSPAPFAGAGTGDGIVADPGGSATGRFYRDDGSFSDSLLTLNEVGYAAGCGAVETQITSKSTAVTCDTITGQIVTHNAALASMTVVAFRVLCAACTSQDVVVLSAQAGTDTGYLFSVNDVDNGSFGITIFNATAGPLSEAIAINYAIVRAVKT